MNGYVDFYEDLLWRFLFDKQGMGVNFIRPYYFIMKSFLSNT